MIDRHTKHDLIPYKPAYDQVFDSFDEAWTYAQEAEIPLRGQTYIVYYRDNAIDSEHVHCIVALCNADKNDEHLFLSDMSYHELRESSKDPEGEIVNKPFPVAVKELNDLILKLTETGGGTGTVVSWEQIYDEGEHIATIHINGESIDVFAPIDQGPQGEQGIGLEYNWDDTKLGVKREDEEEFVYHDLQGPQGPGGDDSWKQGITVTSDGKVFIKGIGGFSGNNENESSPLQDILVEVGMTTGIDVTVPITYIIEFDDYDGTVLKQSNVLKNTMPTEPEAPTRSGYTFIGWDRIVVPAVANTTYTAQYEKIPIDVTFVGTDFDIPTTKDDILLSSLDMTYDSSAQSLKASSSNKTFTLQAKNDANITSFELTTNSTSIRYQLNGITDENGNVIASSCVRNGNSYAITLISPATTINCKNNGGGVQITQIVVHV